MRQLQPVLWTKGTLLSPQHLQTQDRFLEDLLRFRVDALSYCPWGFRQLRINQDALASGSFGLASAEGIFPDGLLFEMPKPDPAPLPRSLAEHFPQGTDVLDVYLAVPSYREKGQNVTAPGAPANARFVAEVSAVRDEVRPEKEKPVQVAQKSVRILFEGEDRRGYSSLRVARVRRGPAGDFELDASLWPPLLDFNANDRLASLARGLVQSLSDRSVELSAARRHKNDVLADFSTSEIPSFWLLYTINSHLPAFRHLSEVRGGHPEELYAEMLAIAGALTTFSRTIHPREMPAYDHAHPSACFVELEQKLRLLLDTVIPKNCIALPMKLLRNSIYATALADDKYFHNTRVYLALQADVPDRGELITLVRDRIKIASGNQIEMLIRQAVNGVEIAHVANPPSSLPRKRDYVYFQLQTSGQHWDAVVRSRNIAAWVPAEFPGADLELNILLPESR